MALQEGLLGLMKAKLKAIEFYKAHLHSQVDSHIDKQLEDAKKAIYDEKDIQKLQKIKLWLDSTLDLLLMTADNFSVQNDENSSNNQNNSDISSSFLKHHSYSLEMIKRLEDLEKAVKELRTEQTAKENQQFLQLKNDFLSWKKKTDLAVVQLKAETDSDLDSVKRKHRAMELKMDEVDVSFKQVCMLIIKKLSPLNHLQKLVNEKMQKLPRMRTDPQKERKDSQTAYQDVMHTDIPTPSFNNYKKAHDGDNQDSDSSLEQTEKHSTDSTKPPTYSNKPLGELFKPKTGSWDCQNCYTRNNNVIQKCRSCDAAKPSAGTSSLSKQVAASTATKPDITFSNAKPYSGGFNFSSGYWECDTCLEWNIARDFECCACNTSKPGAKATETPKPISGTAIIASGRKCLFQARAVLGPNKTPGNITLFCSSLNNRATIWMRSDTAKILFHHYIKGILMEMESSFGPTNLVWTGIKVGSQDVEKISVVLDNAGLARQLRVTLVKTAQLQNSMHPAKAAPTKPNAVPSPISSLAAPVPSLAATVPSLAASSTTRDAGKEHQKPTLGCFIFSAKPTVEENFDDNPKSILAKSSIGYSTTSKPQA